MPSKVEAKGRGQQMKDEPVYQNELQLGPSKKRKGWGGVDLDSEQITYSIDKKYKMGGNDNEYRKKKKKNKKK